MDDLLYYMLLLLVCVLLPLFIVVLVLRRPSSKLPPGPPGLPFIGHLHLLGSNPHHSLCTLSKTYGPLMSLRFGSMPIIVASSPSMARLILQTHDHTFAFRMQSAVPTQIHNCSGVVFTQPGPYLKLVRQIFFADLVSKKRLESFRPLIAEEVHSLLCSILDTPGEVPLRAKLYTTTAKIISRMAVGNSAVTDLSSNLITMLLEVTQLVGIFNMGDFIPCLAWMDLQGCVHRSKELGKKLHIVWQAVIDERREMRYQSNNHIDLDFLDMLITAASERRDDIAITDLNISAILTDIFGAGIDTSSTTTEWALAELIKNPIKMKEVQDELERIVGMSRLVHEKDLPHLSYLRAVVKETLRLHPSAPLLVPHKASKECHISSYDIPANTLTFINVWAMGRDPSIWERPLEFCPERFLDCNTDVHGHHFELLPFGSGRRACPGLALGLSNVQYMLASLLHCFNWSTIEKPNMSEKFGAIVALENPLVTKVTPRVSRLLFNEQ